MRYLNLGLLSGLTLMSVLAHAESNPNDDNGSQFKLSHISQHSLRARQIVVDQTADSLSGNCQKGVTGQCNLRAAVKEAQTIGGNLTIALANDAIIDQGQILIAPLPPKKLELTIKGQNGMQSISNAGYSRLFQVDQLAKVNLENLIISKFQAYDGGAVLNYGTMKLKGTVFRENKANCFGTGAMTAFATCGGGAFSNAGKITLGDGTLFEDNEAKAVASTASFTTSSSFGGAIASSGTIILDGIVAFNRNAAIAEATSGFHPMPNGGASSTASGGAISNFGGTLKVTNAGKGKCLFHQNVASAIASTPYGTATSASLGGAIASIGGTVQGLPAGCAYQGNTALTDPDTHIVP